MAKTPAGGHRTTAPEGARLPAIETLRRALRAAKKPESRVATTYDEFGNVLYLFACVLTEDVKLAEQLSVQAIVAHRSGPSTLQDLSAGVHGAWQAWGNLPLSARASPLPGTSPGALMLHEIHGLPDDQRAALRLCKYGGHTYLQAADLLGVSPEQVARLLCDALRSLATPLAPCVEPSPAA